MSAPAPAPASREDRAARVLLLEEWGLEALTVLYQALDRLPPHATEVRTEVREVLLTGTRLLARRP